MQNSELTLPRNTKTNTTPTPTRPLFAHKGSYLNTEAQVHPMAQLSQAKERACRIVPCQQSDRESAGGEKITSFLNSHTRSSLEPSLNCLLAMGPTPFLRRLLEVGQFSTHQRSQRLPCCSALNHLVAPKYSSKKPGRAGRLQRGPMQAPG